MAAAILVTAAFLKVYKHFLETQKFGRMVLAWPGVVPPPWLRLVPGVSRPVPRPRQGSTRTVHAGIGGAMSVAVHVSVGMRIKVCMHVFLPVYVCVFVCARLVCTRISVCARVRMCVCACAYVCSMHVYVLTNNNRQVWVS